jgi:hypothetical protein
MYNKGFPCRVEMADLIWFLINPGNLVCVPLAKNTDMQIDFSSAD